MIQELYFVPHSVSRSQNQMNTSVTLRYDTKTEKLQLVDVFGKTKNINIDTDPDDLKFDDLLSTITIDYIKELGFETAEETEAKATTVSTGFGLGVEVEDTNYTVFLKKDVVTGIIEEEVTPEKIQSWFSAQSGIVYNAGTFELDGPFIDNRLTSFLDQAGYVPHDNDTLYHADNETLNLNVTPIPSSELDPNPSGTTNTFSVNQEWLSGFVSGFLDEADVIPLSAGEGISVENIDVDGQETNVISLTAHIPTGILDTWEAGTVKSDISGLGFIQLADVPVYTAGTDIEVSDEKVISFTGHIPTGVCDVWTDDQNVADISGLGFALREELHDTLYYADNTSLDLSSGNIFSINQQWLSTFVQSFGYLTEDVDTTYVGSDSITISGDTNIISVNEVWLGEAAAPIVISNITTEQGQTAVKSIITKEYISGLGFVLTDSDEDTKYYAAADGGLTLTNTDFAVDTDWLSAHVDTYIDNRVTSTFVANTGVKITDTRIVSGIGVLVESDVNGDPQIQMVSVDTDWLTNQISAYNDLNGITSAANIIASSGLSIEDTATGDRIISLTATIPTGLASWESSINTEYIAGLGFVLAGNDKDTKYGVVEQGGLTINTDNNFAIDNNWMNTKLADYAQLSDIPVVPSAVSEFENDANYATVEQLPTKVSDLSNDKSFVTVAELEAIRLSLLEQFANITSVTDVDGDVNAPTQNLFIDSENTLTANTSFVGKSITVRDLNNENSFTKFVSTGDVVISNMDNSGTLPKATSNAQVIINTPGRVTITDSTIAQNGYNAIEIGLDSTVEPPKSVLIDGVDFTGTLSNNAISIFGTADDAVVTISNCKFGTVSNPLRISNRTNSKLTVNIINCQFGNWEANLDYTGMILCQDYTSDAGSVESNNLFGNGKITINISNCTKNGVKIVFDDPTTVCGTKDANQLLYVYRDKGGGLVAYDASKFPKISAN